MPDSVKRLLEAYEVVDQTPLVLVVFLYDDSAIEDLFYCALLCSRSKICLFLSDSSALVLSWLRLTQSMILLGWLMVQQF